MKYLIILLLSFSALASWEANVSKDGRVTNKGKGFIDKASALKWYSEQGDLKTHTIIYENMEIKESTRAGERSLILTKIKNSNKPEWEKKLLRKMHRINSE